MSGHLCVLGGTILPLVSSILRLDFGTILTVFIFILLLVLFILLHMYIQCIYFYFLCFTQHLPIPNTKVSPMRFGLGRFHCISVYFIFQWIPHWI